MTKNGTERFGEIFFRIKKEISGMIEFTVAIRASSISATHDFKAFV